MEEEGHAEKRSKLEVMLAEFRRKNPAWEYRISPVTGAAQRKSSLKWVRICSHDRVEESCTRCGGAQICEHQRQRSKCFDCGGGAMCPHKKRRHRCRECGGNGFCIHDKAREQCVTCGGSAVCVHARIRSTCKDCVGGSICKHNKYRTLCRECGGGSLCVHEKKRTLCLECGGGSYCEHGKKRWRCVECKGAELCSACGKRRNVGDGFCTRCHPDFVERGANSSKVACAFFDALEKEIGVSIQHIHYDVATKSIVGEEHHPFEWPNKCVDGYYDNPDGTLFAFEFLGDQYHGHKRLWADDHEAKNYLGQVHKDQFYDTERKLQKLSDLGYHVVYIWETDFKNKPALTSLHKICRTFDGELKCE